MHEYTFIGRDSKQTIVPEFFQMNEFDTFMCLNNNAAQMHRGITESESVFGFTSSRF